MNFIFFFVVCLGLIAKLLTSYAESSRYVIHLFDIPPGRLIFGRELRLASDDPQPVIVTVRYPGELSDESSNMTLQPKDVITYLVPSRFVGASRLNAFRVVEVSSNGSLNVDVIIANDVTIRLIPINQLGREYYVISPFNYANASVQSIDVFITSVEDNTTVTVQTENEAIKTVASTLNSFETFATKRNLSSERLRIFSSKPIAVFTLEVRGDDGKLDGNDTADLFRGLTVMQAIPVTLWPAGYCLSCFDCETMSIYVNIFAVSSNDTTKVWIKDRTSDRRSVTISRPEHTVSTFLRLDKSPTTILADQEILLLLHNTNGSKNGQKTGRIVVNLDANAPNTTEIPPATLLIGACTDTVVGWDAVCAVDIRRRSIDFNLNGTSGENNDKWIVKYGSNYRSSHGDVYREPFTATPGTWSQSATATGLSTAAATATELNPYQAVTLNEARLSGSNLEEATTNVFPRDGGHFREDRESKSFLGQQDQTPEMVENQPIRINRSVGVAFETTLKIDRRNYTSPSPTKSNEALSTFNSNSPPNSTFTGIERDDDASIPVGKTTVPKTDFLFNIVRQREGVTSVYLETEVSTTRDRTNVSVGRLEENNSKSVNISEPIRYKTINSKSRDQNRPMHKTLSMFVMKQDVVDKAGHRVVNYFEIDSSEVDHKETGVSPTVIAVITSLCGAVFFVIACILGFVITEVFCTKGKIQRSKISPFLEITNSGY